MQPCKALGCNDSSDSLDSLVFTLDPRDKYLPPGVRRARTTSAIQQRRTFLPRTPRMPLTTAKCDTSEAENSPPTASSTRDGPTLRPQRSLISVFDKLRRTKSAGSSTPRATTSWHRKVFSRAGSRAGSKAGSLSKAILLEDIPAVPSLPAHILSTSNCDGSRKTLPPAPSPIIQRSAFSVKKDSTMSLNNALEGLSLSSSINDHSHANLQEGSPKQQGPITPEILNTSLQGKFGVPSRPRPVVFQGPEMVESRSQYENPDSLAPETGKLPLEASVSPVSHAQAPAAHQSPLEERNIAVKKTSAMSRDEEDNLIEHSDPALRLSYAESSFATDDSFSPNLASSSTQSMPMSPLQLSQPETPNLSDFDDDDDASWTGRQDSLDINVLKMEPPSRAPPPPPSSQAPVFSNPFRVHPPLSGFQGYSLPQDEQGSMHTLRKPASTTSVRTDHPLDHQTSPKDLVHSWNDGSEHRITALEELVDDLGYLGAFIV